MKARKAGADASCQADVDAQAEEKLDPG